MAEWLIAGLLGAVLVVLYVELRIGARDRREMREDLHRATDRMERTLRNLINGEGS